jgi:hypothetical protein
MKGISLDFSDCGLHYDEYTENEPIGNLGTYRACIETMRACEKF